MFRQWAKAQPSVCFKRVCAQSLPCAWIIRQCTMDGRADLTCRPAMDHVGGDVAQEKFWAESARSLNMEWLVCPSRVPACRGFLTVLLHVIKSIWGVQRCSHLNRCRIFSEQLTRCSHPNRCWKLSKQRTRGCQEFPCFPWHSSSNPPP